MVEIHQIARLFLGLVTVTGLLFIVAYVVKKLKYNNCVGGGKGITVISNLMLGNKERIILLEVEGQKALIGITSNVIQTLMLLNQSATPQTDSFKIALQKLQEAR